LTSTEPQSFQELLAISPRVPCAVDTAKFFGDSADEDEPYNDQDAGEAARICMTCPLKYPCLTDAIANNELWGVRGGTTPGQRARLREQGRR
jgi:hypothetical protein